MKIKLESLKTGTSIQLSKVETFFADQYYELFYYTEHRFAEATERGINKRKILIPAENISQMVPVDFSFLVELSELEGELEDIDANQTDDLIDVKTPAKGKLGTNKGTKS